MNSSSQLNELSLLLLLLLKTAGITVTTRINPGEMQESIRAKDHDETLEKD